MNKLVRGMAAGFIATVVLSVLMAMKTTMGVMPELDLPRMIAGMMGMGDVPVVGWAVHFMIGIVIYGAAIAILDERLPGDRAVVHGLIVGSIGWLMMMVVLMPMVGAGMFGLHLGAMAPLMTLVLHLIFGAVLGWYYGRAISSDSKTHLRRA